MTHAGSDVGSIFPVLAVVVHRSGIIHANKKIIKTGVKNVLMTSMAIA